MQAQTDAVAGAERGTQREQQCGVAQPRVLRALLSVSQEQLLVRHPLAHPEAVLPQPAPLVLPRQHLVHFAQEVLPWRRPRRVVRHAHESAHHRLLENGQLHPLLQLLPRHRDGLDGAEIRNVLLVIEIVPAPAGVVDVGRGGGGWGAGGRAVGGVPAVSAAVFARGRLVEDARAGRGKSGCERYRRRLTQRVRKSSAK